MGIYWCIPCGEYWKQPQDEIPECPVCGDKYNPVAVGNTDSFHDALQEALSDQPDEPKEGEV